jgi:putative phosphoribosyl transferase
MFQNREEAGRKLGERLHAYAGREETIVLGVPRGGVVVAYEVAKALDVPLDVLVLRKLGVPWQEELAFGAIAAGGVRILDDDTVELLSLSQADIERVAAKEQIELERRERTYRAGKAPLDLRGKTVILVDDGIATGASARAAIHALRAMGPQRIVLAVPVAPRATAERLGEEADEVVCAETPETFYAIGQFYADFFPVEDLKVIGLLERAAPKAAENAGRKD